MQHPLHNTALHLAAMSGTPGLVRSLSDVPRADAKFLNAVNADGDTALHVAAKRKNVDALRELLQDSRIDVALKNNKGLTAAECAPSDRFGFEVHGVEHAMAELFHKAEGERTQGIEMSSAVAGTAAKAAAAGATGAPDAAKRRTI